MSFGLGAHTLPRVFDYQTAVRAYEKSYVRRDGIRLLMPKKKLYCRVTMDERTGDIAFQYHDTDVVTWHKDESFTVEPYPSRSTNTFANQLIPNGCTLNTIEAFGDTTQAFMYLHSPMYSLWNNPTKVIALPLKNHNEYTFVKLSENERYERGIAYYISPDTPPETVSYPSVNRKRARELSTEWGLDRFATWFTAAVKLAGGLQPNRRFMSWNQRKYVEAHHQDPFGRTKRWWVSNPGSVLGLIKSGEYYEAAQLTPADSNPIDELRRHLYQHYGAIDFHETDELNYAEVRRLHKRLKKYY